MQEEKVYIYIIFAHFDLICISIGRPVRSFFLKLKPSYLHRSIQISCSYVCVCVCLGVGVGVCGFPLESLLPKDCAAAWCHLVVRKNAIQQGVWCRSL